MAISFDDLQDFDFDSVVAKPASGKYARTEQYPCTGCGGSGLYLGVRIHEERTECFACRGKGYFLTSAADRAKARQSRVDRAAKKTESRWEEWATNNEPLAAYLLEVQSWNGFAASLIEGIRKYGQPTERQNQSLVAMHEKHLARQAERSAAVQQKAVIDLRKIHEIFGNAQQSGLKRIAMTIGDLRISLAPATGSNAGCLYVKDSGEYAGKITQDGKFFGLREARKEIEAELIELATDPLAKAKQHGQQTGQCSCCGRELTNEDSIGLGIGPICAQKWGI
jgi:hypothetical protein